MKNTGAAVNGLATGAMIATTAIMLIPGPVGIAVAAIAGIGVAVYSFINNMALVDAELKAQTEALTKLKEMYAEEASAVQRAQQAYSELEQARKANDASRIKIAEEKLRNATLALSEGLQQELAAAQSATQAQEILAKRQGEVARRGKAAERGEAASKESELLQAAERREKIMGTMKKTLIGILTVTGLILAKMAFKGAGDAARMASTAFATGRGRALAGGASSAAASARGAAGAGAALKHGGKGIISRTLGRALLFITPLLKKVSALFAGGLMAGLKGIAIAAGKFIALAAAAAGILEAAGRAIQWVGKMISKIGGPFKYVGKALGWVGDKLKVITNVTKLIGGWMQLRKMAKDIAEYANDYQDKKTGEYTEEGMQKMEKDAKDVYDALDPKKVQAAMKADPAKLTRLVRRHSAYNEDTGFTEVSAEGQKALINELVQMGMDADTAATYVKKFGHDAVMLTSRITKFAQSANALAAEQKRLKLLADQRAAAEAALAAATANTIRVYGEAQMAAHTLAKGLVANARAQKENAREQMMQMAKGGSKIAAQFMSPEDQTRQQFALRNLQIGEKYRQNTDKITMGSGDAMMKLVEGNEELQKAMSKAGSDPAATQLHQALAKAGVLAKQGAGAGVVGKEIQTAMMNAQKAGLIKDSNSLNKQMVKIMAEQLTSLGQAEATRKHQLRMSQVQAQLAQAQNRINRQAKAGGGIKAFMDPGALDKQEEGFNNSLERFQKAQGRGDVVTSGRAAGGLLKNLEEFMGGTQNAPWAEGLKDVLQTGLATDLKSRAMARADVLEQAGRATGDQNLLDAASALRGMDFDQIAKTQVALEHKRKNMPVNIAKLVQWQNTLASLQQRDLMANTATAANTAKMANELVPGFIQGLQGMAASGAFGATPGAAGAAGMGSMDVAGPTKADKQWTKQFKDALGKRENVAAEIQRLIKSGKSVQDPVVKKLIGQLKYLDTGIADYTKRNKAYADQIAKTKMRVARLHAKKKAGGLTAEEEAELTAGQSTLKMADTYRKRGQMAAANYGFGKSAGNVNKILGQQVIGTDAGVGAQQGDFTGLQNQGLGMSAMLGQLYATQGQQFQGGSVGAVGVPTAAGGPGGVAGSTSLTAMSSRQNAARKRLQALVVAQRQATQGPGVGAGLKEGYFKGKTGGQFVQGGAAQQNMKQAIAQQMQQTQRNMQILREQKAQGTNPQADRHMQNLIVEMEVLEQAMAKVNRGQMIGGAAGAMGGSQNAQALNTAMKNFWEQNIMLQPNINITIPAGISLSGRDEVYQMKQQVSALQAQVGTPSSATGGGMP